MNRHRKKINRVVLRIANREQLDPRAFTSAELVLDTWTGAYEVRIWQTTGEVETDGQGDTVWPESAAWESLPQHEPLALDLVEALHTYMLRAFDPQRDEVTLLESPARPYDLPETMGYQPRNRRAKWEIALRD